MRCISGGDSFDVNLKVRISMMHWVLDKFLQMHLLPILIISLILFSSNFVCAADTKIIPKITVSGSYDDNIFFDVNNKVSSSIITTSPGVEADYKTSLSNLALKADWDVLSYLDQSDQNRTNQYYQFSGDHKFSEKLDTAIGFKYYKDTTLNSYLQETGRVFELLQRDFYEAEGEASYDITELSGISTKYRFQHASYSGNTEPDYDNHSVDLYYVQHLKDQVDTFTLGPSYYHRHNDFDNVDSYSLDLGWSRRWSSLTNSHASIGARYSTINRSDGIEKSGWGAKANLSIESRGLVSVTKFNYFHDMRTSVDGGEVNVDNFFLTYQYLITERFGAGIDGRLVFSYKFLNQQTNINDERYYWVEPRLFYKITPNLDLSLRYRYENNLDYLDSGNETRDRNIVWLQLSYAIPMLI